MTECWSEGELRAYLDGELPARDMESAAAHLERCAACGALHRELAARSAHVMALVGTLPEPGDIVWVRPAVAPFRPRRRWAVAVLAAAAVLLLALAVRMGQSSRPVERAVRVVPQPPAVTPQPRVEVKPTVQPAVIRRLAPRRKPAPQRVAAAQPDYFMVLDDEPMQTGEVLRVALGADEVKADVIFGSDGRARAIRLVNDK